MILRLSITLYDRGELWSIVKVFKQIYCVQMLKLTSSPIFKLVIH